MTVQEKREILINEIQQIPEAFLDDISVFVIALKYKSEKKNISDEDFQKALIETSQKYSEVWKALA
ncbi:MAG: hypothetical protein H7Y04_01775 [Verrucomicrobia bacterium]|nr:hypothetical protein [Cytophagales bacterium]